MKKINNEMMNLFAAIKKVSEKRKEYLEAINEARLAGDELTTLCQEIINQPHVIIDDYEIDN